MIRIAFAVPVVAAALLAAGCTSPGPRNPASTSMAPQAQPVAYWAGTGVVQSVTPAPAPLNATGGATTAQSRNPSATTPATSGLHRLRIRMDDGRMMYVDTPSADIAPGTRVQLTENNEIRRM